MSDSPQIPSNSPQPPHGNVLSDNAVGALAYLTFVPAIIFLMVEPYNRSAIVRFHAWQSIFLSLACIPLWFIIFVLLFIPILGWITIFFLGLGFFALWALALLRALKGDRWKLPFIGRYAAKQAGI